MLRAFCGTKDTSPKSNLAKEKKIALPKSENALGSAEIGLGYRDSSGEGIEPRSLTARMRCILTAGYSRTWCLLAELAITFLNDEGRLWRDLRRAPVRSCTQKTPAIDR